MALSRLTMIQSINEIAGLLPSDFFLLFVSNHYLSGECSNVGDDDKRVCRLGFGS